jgi:hypothetical protein
LNFAFALAGAAVFAGAFALAGAAVFAGAFALAGAAVFAGAFALAGAAVFAGTFALAGAAVFAGALTLAADFAGFLSAACVNAEAATLLTGGGVLGFLSNFDALLATVFEVFSLLAISNPPPINSVKPKSIFVDDSAQVTMKKACFNFRVSTFAQQPWDFY